MESFTKYKVALAASSAVVGDKEDNLNTALRDIKKANETGAKLILFPEMFLTGYMVFDGEDYETVFKLAEPIDGPSIKKLAEWAREYNIYIVMGMPLCSQIYRGVIHNAAVFIGPEGVIGAHCKVAVPAGSYRGGKFYEGHYVRPGNSFEVFDTPLGRIGMLICYEVAWPEITRVLAVKGADLLVHINAATPDVQANYGLVPRVRAIENVCYLAWVNLAGVEKGVTFFGGGEIIAPSGAMVVKAEGEDFVVGEVDLDNIKLARRAYPLWKDRVHPELFSDLSSLISESH